MGILAVRRLAGISPPTMLALQRRLLGISTAGRPAEAPILLLMECDTPTILLGRYQTYRPGETAPPPNEITRRLTGGRAVVLGPGILWVSLVMPSLTELAAPGAMPITPDRALNRYCRGILRGLSSLGVPAFYPGQDCITVRRRPLALLSVDVTPEGRTVFDCLISVHQNGALIPASLSALAPADLCTLPAHSSTTVAGELGREITIDEVATAVVRGYAEQSQMTPDWLDTNPLEEQLLSVIRDQEVMVPAWIYRGVPSPEHELSVTVAGQLGSFQVGCALQQRSFLTNVTFAGEFIATGQIIDALERKLRLCPAQWKAIGVATDEVFTEPYRTILGIGPRQTIPNTVMQAVDEPAAEPAPKG